MPDYRRLYVKGGTYFFTVVTYNRRPIFTNEPEINLLLHCMQVVSENHPFQIDAFVIMPDHLHALWTLPENDADFSLRWRQIKSQFTRQFQRNKSKFGEINSTEITYNVWQRGFWEHLIRDQEDFNRHCDYIHFNPVKHGLASSPDEYDFSSFHTFMQKGIYKSDWGKLPDKTLLEMDLE